MGNKVYALTIGLLAVGIVVALAAFGTFLIPKETGIITFYGKVVKVENGKTTIRFDRYCYHPNGSEDEKMGRGVSFLKEYDSEEKFLEGQEVQSLFYSFYTQPSEVESQAQNLAEKYLKKSDYTRLRWIIMDKEKTKDKCCKYCVD